MSIFTRKQKLFLEEFCKDFYDKNILNPEIGGVNIAISFTEVFKISIAEVDSFFNNIDIQTLVNEITLLRFELFSLAFLHQLGDKNTAAQSQFTKEYLQENERYGIWEDLEIYNKAIATSSRLNQNPETKKGQAYLLFLDRMRMDLFDLWYKEGFESKCVARAANRIMTDVAWKKKLTHTYLMVAFCTRLGYKYNAELGSELNKEVQFRIMAMVDGIYNGAKEALKKVIIE
ncbi:MAG: hypothetical protein Q7S39_09695 [Ignavibacteria bacterium]|nr:hypothetical protein [Ignavibacteria bacterium]